MGCTIMAELCGSRGVTLPFSKTMMTVVTTMTVMTTTNTNSETPNSSSSSWSSSAVMTASDPNTQCNAKKGEKNGHTQMHTHANAHTHRRTIYNPKRDAPTLSTHRDKHTDTHRRPRMRASSRTHRWLGLGSANQPTNQPIHSKRNRR